MEMIGHQRQVNIDLKKKKTNKLTVNFKRALRSKKFLLGFLLKIFDKFGDELHQI